jgi:hypothetical protein
MYSVASYCPHCGAPIYVPMSWGGVTPPPPSYSCDCRLRLGMKPPIGFRPTTSANHPYWDMLPNNVSSDYRITDEQREAWKRASGRLTGLIPHGRDGETLSEYITRKRWEENNG